MDQVCFTGESSCSSFRGHMLKLNFCTNCNKDIVKHKKDVVAKEDLLKALEYSQKGMMIPSLILPKDDVHGALYLGGFKTVTNEKFIKEADVKGVVNTAGKGLFKFFGPKFERNYHASIETHHITLKVFEWVDAIRFDIPESDLSEAVKFIKEQRKNGAVLVHCAQGKSRSSTAVVAYLMTIMKIGWEDALKFVQERRKMADPNMHFRYILEMFEKSDTLEALRNSMS